MKRVKTIVERDAPALSYEIVEGNLKNLQGRVLTILEAAAIIPDSRLVAAKSLVKEAFNDKLTHFFSLYGHDSEQETPKYSK
jgi:hypothetical protein